MIGVESLLECVAPALAMIRQNMSQNIIPLLVSPCVRACVIVQHCDKYALMWIVVTQRYSCERTRGKTLDHSLKERDTFFPYQIFKYFWVLWRALFDDFFEISKYIVEFCLIIVKFISNRSTVKFYKFQ